MGLHTFLRPIQHTATTSEDALVCLLKTLAKGGNSNMDINVSSTECFGQSDFDAHITAMKRKKGALMV